MRPKNGKHEGGPVIRLMIGLGCMVLTAGAWAQNDTAKAAVPADMDTESGATTSSASAPAGAASAEELENLKGKVDGLNESYLETKSTVDKLAKIKVSGYIQAQWQHADSVGVASFAGGNFPASTGTAAGTDQRFQVRRGRLKTTYETPTSRYVLQIDVIPAGVTLKDAYVTLMEPWLKTFSYTMGVFDRPFGFEIGYSSSSRESPERARVFQTLFPGERDMGAKLDIAPAPELGLIQYLNFKGGIFTGLGPTTNEIDSEQDIIGRLGFQAPLYDLNLALDGGFSGYFGKVTNVNDTSFQMGTSAGVKTWQVRTGQNKATLDREIMGVDGQLYYDVPILGGLSLRGEYLWGTHPGSTGSSTVYTGGTPAATAANPNPSGNKAASRDVMGWYVNYVQNLGSKVQAVVKYDVFDPNTEVDGDDVGATGSNLTAGDLAISTLGLGLLYYWDENLRFTFYYDMVTNEESNATGTANSANAAAALNPWEKDLSDNVFTFRAQVKF